MENISRPLEGGYLNTLSANTEVEVRAYYNESMRASALINAARTQLARQPRNYTVLGIEPRAPFPKGHVLPDGDWSILDPVKARGGSLRGA